MVKEIYKWAGTEDSFSAYQRYLEYIQENPRAEAEANESFAFSGPMDKKKKDDEEDDMDMRSYLVSSYGNVAVIAVDGPMVPNDSFLAQLFGLVPYPEIVRAINDVMADESVDSVVFNFDSPGGTVAGIDDVVRGIGELSKDKTVVAVTSGSMTSAAYWIASTADKVYSTRMAQVGSIGVIAKIFSVSRMLEKDGIDVKVIRAGKEKALGQTEEPISDKAVQKIQEELDTIYDFFVEHVAGQRGLSISARDIWAEGQVFFGEKAVAVGLVDRIASPEEVISDLYVDNQQSPANNTPVNSTNYGVNDMPRLKKVVMSDRDKAAIAAGAPLDQVEHIEVDDEETLKALGVEDQNDAAASSESQENPSATETPAEVNGDAASTDSKVSSDIVLELTQKLSEASAALALEKSRAEALAAEIEKSKADMKALTSIAAEAVQRMEIAVYERATSEEALAGLSASALTDKYYAVKQEFEEAFGVARRSVESLKEPDGMNGIPPGIVPKK